MGQGACLIIINGGRAYAATENLADRIHTVNTYNLEVAITASCNVVPYASLYLEVNDGYLEPELMQPIIDLHKRIINELPFVEKGEAQALVDELADALFAASENIASSVGT